MRMHAQSPPEDIPLSCHGCSELPYLIKEVVNVGYSLRGFIMKTKYLTIATALVLAAMIAAPAAYANDGKKGKDGHKGLHGMFFHKAHYVLKNEKTLGLSDEQVKAIVKLKIETKKNLIRQKADAKIIGVDIKAALYDDKIDTEKVNKLLDQKYEVKKSLAKSLVDSLAKLKGILSEEQLEKLKDLRMCGKK